MHSNQWKANMTLLAVVLGFLITSFFIQTFWGALFFHGLTAGLVGGIADWFAVTALFRKPLGISFRTAIIPRNRQRIFQDITDMVQNTLLSKVVLKEKILSYPIIERLILYLDQGGGKTHIQAILHQVLLDLICRIKPHDLGQMAENIVKDQLEKYSLSALLAKVIQWTMQEGYDGKILQFLTKELNHILEQEQMKGLVIQIIEKTKQAYIQNMDRRRVVLWMLEQSGMTSERITELVLQKAADYFKDAENENHPLRQKLRQWGGQFVCSLEQDQEVQDKIESLKKELILGRISLRRPVTDWISQLQEDAKSQQGVIVTWLDYIDKQVDDLFEQFKQDQVKQDLADQWIKNQILEWIDQYHYAIGKLVQQNLSQYDDQALIDLIQHKVGDDLQMIRINGSVVGGLAGMMIYLISLAAR